MDDPINRADVWGLSDEDNSTDAEDSALRVLFQGAKGAKTGRKIGGAIGERYGVRGPGAATGTFVGNAIGMALQTIAEYPPAKEKARNLANGLVKQLKNSIEAQTPQADTDEASESDASIYSTSPD